MIPSLSVVQTVPSRRRNVAPALSSPPNPNEPSINPATNHLNPTGTSSSRRPSRPRPGRSSRTRRASCRPPTSVLHPRAPRTGTRCNREEVVRVHQPGRRVTMPCRSASVSLPNATSNRSLQLDEPCHRVRRRRVHPDLAVPVDGHEAELRVDRRLTTVSRARSARRSAASRRRDAPPSGSTPIAGRTTRWPSMSMTEPRSLT